MEGKLGESHSGELHRETAEQRANRILAEDPRIQIIEGAFAVRLPLLCSLGRLPS